MAEHIRIGDITPWEQTVQTVAGNRDFQFHFPIFKDEDLEVFVDENGPLVLGVDYTVSGAGNDDGGSFTLATAPTVGALVTRRRRLAIQRTSDFQDSGEFRAKVLNDELDYQTAAIQQIALDIARSLVTNPTDPAGNLTLPTVASRKGKYWLWDASTGNPSLSAGIADVPVSAAMAPVLSAATLILARAAMGLAIGPDVLAPGGDGSGLSGILTQGKHTFWIPAPAVKSRASNGCATLAYTETSTNKVNLPGLGFDPDSIEYGQTWVWLPKSYNGSTISAIPVWWHAATTTNFKTSWGLQGAAFSDGAAGDTAFGTAVYSNDTGGTTNAIYLGPETAAMTLGGSPAGPCLACFQSLRKADDATNDTLAVDAMLLGWVGLYTINKGNDA